MKKMSSIIQVLIVAILILSSCKNKYCESNKLGTLTLSERADNFLIYKDSQVLTFVNQRGEELKGRTNQHDLHDRVNLKIIGDGYEALNGTKSTCHDYYDIIRKNNGIRFEESDLSINIMVWHVSDNNIDIKERVSFVLRDKKDSDKTVEGYYDYETDEFANPVYEENGVSVKSVINELELNSKTFTDVLAAENENSAIYFKEDKGVIGFSVDGDIWVLE